METGWLRTGCCSRRHDDWVQFGVLEGIEYKIEHLKEGRDGRMTSEIKHWKHEAKFRCPVPQGGLTVIPALSGRGGAETGDPGTGFSESKQGGEQSGKTLEINLCPLHACVHECIGMPIHIYPYKCRHTYAHIIYTFICTCENLGNFEQVWSHMHSIVSPHSFPLGSSFYIMASYSVMFVLYLIIKLPQLRRPTLNVSLLMSWTIRVELS